MKAVSMICSQLTRQAITPLAYHARSGRAHRHVILARDYGRAIRRHELAETEREFTRPLLLVPLSGRKRLDDRTVLNGIVWKFRTGVAWRYAPERYGSRARLHTRFRRWAKDDTSSGC
ncbi:transposase [Streptomyces sp. NPDC058086]|uniref:transposase n=1 Tax=Streptomyces sp. NPDC058086 TaxID=3346334 RepID=UPI0036E17444